MPKKLTRAACRPGKRPTGSSRRQVETSNLCHLGIDIGSHRTRISIFVPSTNTEITVENRHSESFSLSTSYYPCDFPSALYVFDAPSSSAPDRPVYLVEREDTTRLSISAKYVFYALANAKDELLEQYPPVKLLLSQKRKRDPRFKAILRSGMVALLTTLRDRAMSEVRSKGLEVGRIGLTIPVQWTLEFEEVYRGLVAEVFKEVGEDGVYFFTETEALARYLFKHHAEEMDPEAKYGAVMFFDFGGHNMNGCVFGVARDLESPERNSFYRVGKPFGAGGGSEQWEHHIGEWFSTLWVENNPPPTPPQFRDDVLSRFRKQKGRQNDMREPVTLIFNRPTDGNPWRATLTLEDIEDAWQKGLKRPLKTAKREIPRLVNMLEEGHVRMPLVVVSGGTARNPAVKARMLALCQENGIPIVFTDDFNIRISDDSAKVAKAAAFCVSETLTVEQFFARGAAVGVQMRQARKQGQPKDTPRPWDDSGSLLLDMRREYEAELAVRWGDEFQLICDPFFDRLPSKSRDCLLHERSYDLVYLGRREQGTMIFRLSFEGSGDDMSLVLRQRYRQRKDGPTVDKETLRLPLYFDGNSGCIQVGDRHKAIEELRLGLPPQPKDTGDADLSTSEEPEQDLDSESIYEKETQLEETTSPKIVSSDIRATPAESILVPTYTTGMFQAAEETAWPSPEDEETDMFHGLPVLPPQVTPGRRKPGGPLSRRVDPYETARWRRKGV